MEDFMSTTFTRDTQRDMMLAQVKKHGELVDKSNDRVAFDSKFMDNARKNFTDHFMWICSTFDHRIWQLLTYPVGYKHAEALKSACDQFEKACNEINAEFEETIAKDQKNLEAFRSSANEALDNSDYMNWIDAEIAKMEAAK